MTREDDIKEIRRATGTMPEMVVPRNTRFDIGVSGIKVKMVDWSSDPYRAIGELVLSTWGQRGEWINKWDKLSDYDRLKVILPALQHQTLPTALECPKFTFMIEGISRAGFDQIARARVGAGFGSIGTRDNSWMDSAFIIPDFVHSRPELEEKYKTTMSQVMDLYEEIVVGNKGSWQVGRFVLPMCTEHRFTMTINYLALQGMCAKRLKMCEEFDTTATMWLIREEVAKRFPLLGAFLRPSCDFKGCCDYSEAYTMSEVFGALFKPCGRNKTRGEVEPFAIFNEVCSSIEAMEEQLHIHIPRPSEWNDIVVKAVRVTKEQWRGER